jgi:uncharacterized membrane protein
MLTKISPSFLVFPYLWFNIHLTLGCDFILSSFNKCSTFSNYSENLQRQIKDRVCIIYCSEFLLYNLWLLNHYFFVFPNCIQSPSVQMTLILPFTDSVMPTVPLLRSVWPPDCWFLTFFFKLILSGGQYICIKRSVSGKISSLNVWESLLLYYLKHLSLICLNFFFLE